MRAIHTALTGRHELQYSVQINDTSALKDLDHEPASDDLPKVWKLD